MTTWKLEQGRRDAASNFAETIVKDLGISKPPIDPFCVVHSERRRLTAVGDDFGEAFDGRLEYQPPQFLIFYNTKYDAWPHRGAHHPKVNFTVAHELGHFFLDPHRNYLRHGGRAHGSKTEFVSDNNSEREADAFAVGLLMPAFLAAKLINQSPPTLESIKAARDLFDVSLTSMMVRTVLLSDFPCAICSIRNGRIDWGFTSTAFKNVGVYSVNRGRKVTSRAACKYLAGDLSRYREETGWGNVEAWLEWPRGRLNVAEYFVSIPSANQVLAFLTADEEEIGSPFDD